ncbi:MAG: discoidin domain-containing protein [Acidiferrobacterales bacterium]|nr:discoidin domain-containing protein [Acidiferrobacterales bacterium]
MNVHALKPLWVIGVFMTLSVLSFNSLAQSAIDRDGWSLSSNRNASNLFSAIDGSANTRWSTNEKQRDGHYFQIDLNRTNTFNQIVLDTSGSVNDYPRQYEVSVSSDGENFMTIAADVPEASGVTEINFSDQTARFVRIDQTGSTDRYWWSIHEINIFAVDGDTSNSGTSDFSDTDNWELNSSSNAGERTFAIDGNANTRWDTAVKQSNGQYYEINFNSVKTFDQILLDTSGSANDYPRGYQIQVSENGNDYSTVATGTPSNNAITQIEFPEQSSQYLKIIQTGADSFYWWSIHELTISYGEDIVDDPDLPDGLHPDIVRVADISPEEILRSPGGDGWKDSYSVGDRCYCDTTYDHDIGGILVDTPVGTITVREACEILGEGPGSAGRPIYNDVQCGNGPANDAGDEDWCPGRVDIGKEGCPHIGPTWNFN